MCPSSQPDILDHRQVVEQARHLKAAGQPSAGAVHGAGRRDVIAAEEDPSGSWPQEPGEEVEQGRLTSAVGSNHREELAVGDVKGDVVDDLGSADAETQAFRSEHVSPGRGRNRSLPVGRRRHV